MTDITQQLVKQGAEAKVFKMTYLGRPCIVKERFVKKYRHPELDDRLTRERIKAECRALVRCKAAGIHTPALYAVNLGKRSIYMEYIDKAQTLKEYISQEIQKKIEIDSGDKIEKTSNLTIVLKDIGHLLGKMHANNIIHGDLTPSNILLTKLSSEHSNVTFIDFGLSAVDESPEDKGVDLYVLERALISSHESSKYLFDIILKAYLNEYKNGGDDVLKKLEEVRARGRKRLMVG